MEKVLNKEEAQKDLKEFADNRKKVDKENAEARDAATATPAEKQKIKEEKEKEETARLAKEAEDKKNQAAKDVEVQAKEDERILSAEDKDLDDKAKARRDILLKKKEPTEEEKEKLRQEKLDKRFGELTGKIKDLERDKESNKAEIGKLRKEKDELEKKVTPSPSEDEIVNKTISEQLKKYAEEDKGKPREERREMVKDELDDWVLTDPTAASVWVVERTLRRTDERKQTKSKLKKADFDTKQLASHKRTLVTHPELDAEKMKERAAALKLEKASDDEIRKTLAKEFPKIMLAMEISFDHPEWEKEENGPELVVEEMEKRQKSAKTSSEQTEGHTKELEEKNKEIEELTKKNEELTLQIEKDENNDIGITSSTIKLKGKEEKLNKQEQELVGLMKSKGASEASIESALKKFRVRKAK